MTPRSTKVARLIPMLLIAGALFAPVSRGSGADEADRLPTEPADASAADTAAKTAPEMVEHVFVGISESRSFEGALADALRKLDKAVADKGRFPCTLASWRIVEIRGKTGSPGGLKTLEVTIAASFETRKEVGPAAEAAPAQAGPTVREIFRPTARGSGQTSWTSLFPRKVAGEPKEYMMIVNAHRGDRWPVTLRGAEEPLFRAELIDGGPDEVQLQILDGARSQTLILNRDAPRTVRIGEKEFRITYGTSVIEGRAPAHVDHATIIVTLPGRDGVE